MTASQVTVSALLVAGSAAMVVGLFVLIPRALRCAYESRLLEVRHTLHMSLLDQVTQPSGDAWDLLSAIEARLEAHHLITPAYAFGARLACRGLKRPLAGPAGIDRYVDDDQLARFAREVGDADRAMVRAGSVSGWVYSAWRAVGGPTPNPQEMVGLILRLQGPPPRSRAPVGEPA